MEPHQRQHARKNQTIDFDQGQPAHDDVCHHQVIIHPVRVWAEAPTTGRYALMDLRDPYARVYFSQTFWACADSKLYTTVCMVCTPKALGSCVWHVVCGILFHLLQKTLGKCAQPDLLLVPADHDVFTVALHSRHAKKAVRGENVTRDTNCLDRLFSKNTTGHDTTVSRG